jgi:hypothetical protein
MQDERVEKQWPEKNGVVVKYNSGRGRHNNLARNREDRIFYITINNGKKWFPTHEQQMKLMELVINNDILPQVKRQHIREYREKLNEIERNEPPFQPVGRFDVEENI